MTRQNDFNLFGKLTEEFIRIGLGSVPLLQGMFDCATQDQRNRYLNAENNEWTAKRQGYANGFKSKTVYIHVRMVTFAIPQVRAGLCNPSA